MSKILSDAEKYEEIMESLIADEARPEFHLTAPVGWMNDPNGFSYHNGQFHLFFSVLPLFLRMGTDALGTRYQFRSASLALFARRYRARQQC